MLRYLLGRLFGIIFVIFAVSVIIFLLMHALPGGPFDEDKVPLSPEAKANLNTSVDLGGRRIIKKKKKKLQYYINKISN
ncbi:MAG: hypothetical protein KDD78_18680, partial [Caldilineaceae bacterium]|nr:hypothetical protein [Caldilineaceae bacterium]